MGQDCVGWTRVGQDCVESGRIGWGRIIRARVTILAQAGIQGSRAGTGFPLARE